MTSQEIHESVKQGPENLAKVEVVGSNPIARSNFHQYILNNCQLPCWSVHLRGSLVSNECSKMGAGLKVTMLIGRMLAHGNAVCQNNTIRYYIIRSFPVEFG
jgi:hypothetical protein